MSYSTNDIINVMDAMGKDTIIVETVGTGQNEVDLIHQCYTSIVVLAPGLGDSIQMIKAGIFEIADIFVVNKADREGADKVESDLREMLTFAGKSANWVPPVYKINAIAGEGINELIDGINAHKRYLVENNLFEKKIKERVGYNFVELLKYDILNFLEKRINEVVDIDKIVDDLYHKRSDPYFLVRDLLNKVLGASTNK